MIPRDRVGSDCWLCIYLYIIYTFNIIKNLLLTKTIQNYLQSFKTQNFIGKLSLQMSSRIS
jgi:hypothetical protein